MSILHLVRTSAFGSDNLKNALNTVTENDAFILLDDGCYCVHHPLLNDVVLTRYAFSIIGEHIEARAITPPASIKVISVDTLIELSFTYTKVMTWQ